MSALLRDIGSSLRTLFRARHYALLSVGCLALGLGANATMFGVADTIFLRAPAAVRDAHSIVRIYFSYSAAGAGDLTTDLVSFPLYTEFRQGTKSFESVAAYHVTNVSEGRGALTAKLRAALVSSAYFHVLGVSSEIGRVWGDADFNGATPVAVISGSLWHTRFGESKSVVGRTLLIAERSYTIIGVAEPRFSGVDLEPVDVWIPLEVAANDLIREDYLGSRGGAAIALLARLKAGVARHQAAAEATIAHRNFMRTLRGADFSSRAVVSPLLRDLGPKETEQAKVSVWLIGVAIAVLVLAGVNYMNLMLLRALSRRREFAVRASLGASPVDVARLLFTESALLALCGAATAVGFALAGTRFLRVLLLSEDVPANFVNLPRLFLFTFGLALTVSVAVSLLPILVVTRGDLTNALRPGGLPSYRVRSPVRTALLIGQIALTTVLLVGAGLFAESLVRVRAADLGFDPRGVLAVNIDFAGISARPNAVHEPEALHARIVEEVRALPGVSSVAVATSVPFQHMSGIGVSVPGRDPRSLPSTSAFLTVASEDYLRTLGLRLIAGRWFGSSDYEAESGSVVINESMSRLFWPGERAIGQCLAAGQPTCSTVIGVVADARRTNLREQPRSQVYLTALRDPEAGAGLPRTLLVRSRQPRAVAALVRRTVQAADPRLPYVTVELLTDLVAPQLRPWELGASVFGLFGALALTLSAVGLYGLLSYSVSEQTHEIGVRVALGARTFDVLRSVLGRVTFATLVGIAVGLLVSWWVAPRIAPLLFGNDARDVGVLATAAVTLAVAASAACYAPARSAARLDPITALRYE